MSDDLVRRVGLRAKGEAFDGRSSASELFFEARDALESQSVELTRLREQASTDLALLRSLNNEAHALRDRNAELEKERDERPWIEKQQSDIMRKMDIELFGWKCQSNEQTNLRILAEARIASLEATVSTLIEALLKLISVIDKCPSYEAGAGGQTIESQLRRTLINRVPALAVEEAREIALAASDTVVREPSKKGDNDGVE